MSDKKDNRGGKRIGAGRKKQILNAKLLRITITAEKEAEIRRFIQQTNIYINN